MCGIFGYIGNKKDASHKVLDGLKLLEYRGYDSWGIAVKKDDELVIEKYIGKIGNATVHLPQSSVGIGHTRWATHGGVTKENAHPHLDCTKQIAIIHNGIIENFQELKEELIKKGHTFLSETDTEVMSHLVEDALKTEKDFATAVRISFNKAKGMNAIVVLFAPTEEIVAAKTGSPLVVGIGKNELFIASDASGIVKHTKKVIFLSDNQMAVLGKTVVIQSLTNGREVKPEVTTLDWNFENTEKGKYDHFLLKEIYEQPRVIENIALNYDDQTKMLATQIKSAFGTFLLGCGTASYVSLAGTYLFSNIAKKHINFSIGSEFNYLEDFITKGSLVIPISQSGETIDVVEPVSNSKKKGATVVALVNVLGSTLYRLADKNVILGAGQEKAVVATKSFSAMISVLILTAYTLAGKQKKGKALLLAASRDIKKLLRPDFIAKVKKLALRLKNDDHIFVIGRGLSYATTLEVTIKLKETSLVHAEGFAGGELKHGPIALIEKGTPCIIIAPNDETYDAIISNAQELKARGGYIIGIGPNENNVYDEFLKTDDLEEATILPQVVISQLLSYYLALVRGVEDPDKPRNLAKSVTVK